MQVEQADARIRRLTTYVHRCPNSYWNLTTHWSAPGGEAENPGPDTGAEPRRLNGFLHGGGADQGRVTGRTVWALIHGNVNEKREEMSRLFEAARNVWTSTRPGTGRLQRLADSTAAWRGGAQGALCRFPAHAGASAGGGFRAGTQARVRYRALRKPDRHAGAGSIPLGGCRPPPPPPTARKRRCRRGDARVRVARRSGGRRGDGRARGDGLRLGAGMGLAFRTRARTGLDTEPRGAAGVAPCSHHAQFLLKGPSPRRRATG